MIKFYAKYSSRGIDSDDEDEKNYETDEIIKENMNEFCTFIADQKSGNTNHTTKYNKETWWKFC